MRIFRKEFNEKLTTGMLLNECIITKINCDYGNFIVNKKIKFDHFEYIGIFNTLTDAINFVETIEKTNKKFEYYSQYQNITDEGLDKHIFQAMGELGWELCAVTPNNNKLFCIYKRQLFIENYSDEDSTPEWNATKEDIEIRNKT